MYYLSIINLDIILNIICFVYFLKVITIYSSLLLLSLNLLFITCRRKKINIL